MAPRARLIALGLAAAFLSGAAKARTYYVSAAGGRDEAAGSADAPWRTLARAVGALRPGDRLVIRAGRYGQGLLLSASGASGRVISVVGEGRPLIEGDGDAVSITGSYLDVEGLEAHSTGWGSAIAVGKGDHHVRIAHNLARDSACGGIAAVETDYLTLEANRVFGNARRAPWQCSGISIYQADASDDRPGFHNVIRGNVVYDNMNVHVDDSVSHSDGHTTDGNGIILDDFDHVQSGSKAPPYRAATLVASNVSFDNGGRGFHVFHSRNVVLVGNVAYHDLKDANLQGPAGELSSAFSQGVTWLDNVAVARPGGIGAMDAYATGADRWDYNLVVADRAMVADHSPVSWGGHMRVAGDAGFVRPGLAYGADFHLRPGSAGQRAGVGVRLGGPGLVQTLGRPAPVGLDLR